MQRQMLSAAEASTCTYGFNMCTNLTSTFGLQMQLQYSVSVAT